MKATLFLYIFLFFQLSSLRNDFIHRMNSYSSEITLKIQTKGINKLFNKNFENPDEIIINNIKQEKISNEYYLNTTENIIKLIWIDILDNCENMFMGCSNITYIDLSNFNTSFVTDMSSMFEGCSLLKSLDLSNLYTSKVTDMYSMFDSCSSLTTLNLSNFDISLVTDMGFMFSGCSSLKSLNLMNFYTLSTTSLQSMFQDCSSLKSLNLSNFNISQSILTSNFLNGCISLEILDLSSIHSLSLQNLINRGELKLKYLILNNDTINNNININLILNITARNGVLCFGSTYNVYNFNKLKSDTCIIHDCSNDWFKIRKKISKENKECYDNCNNSYYEYDGECYKDCPLGTKKSNHLNIFAKKYVSKKPHF